MTIDITKPLELSDGTPVTMADSHLTGSVYDWIEVNSPDFHCYFMSTGEANLSWLAEANGRTLRNVKETKMEHRTSEECLQRMEALVRRLASSGVLGQPLEIERAAIEIVAELDAVNGPNDVTIMQDILREDYGPLDNPNNCEGPKRVAAILEGKVDYWEARLALKCLAKGRELEAERRKLHIENYNPDVIDIKFVEHDYDIRVSLKAQFPPMPKMGSGSAIQKDNHSRVIR